MEEAAFDRIHPAIQMLAVRGPPCGRDCTWNVQYGARQMRVALQKFGQKRALSATDVHDVTKSGAVDRGSMDRCAAVLVLRDEVVEKTAICLLRFHVLEETPPIRAVKCRLACSNAVFQVVPGTSNAAEAPIQRRGAAGDR